MYLSKWNADTFLRIRRRIKNLRPLMEENGELKNARRSFVVPRLFMYKSFFKRKRINFVHEYSTIGYCFTWYRFSIMAGD